MAKSISELKSSRLVKVSVCFAVIAFLSVFYGLAIYNTPATDAKVKATDFNAGRIIDDEVFYDANTMTAEEIQAFLDEKLPTCDMWGTGSSAGRVVNETGYVMPAGSTNADYARLRAAAGNTRYHEPPYVCVNKYYENPETHETLYDTNGIVKEGMISAAQIIYNEAQKYSINPQVLLVLIKKESYIWGDTWPLKWEYNSVMGYGCPDTAPCDSTYYGFYNQVHMAAYQFDRYKQKNYEYNYHPGMVNTIYYSPNYSCGTKQVYIENMATASLYIYTPYTPNDAALQNYPGTSYCGSYGNRNFFMYFSEWFGDPHVPLGAKKIETRYEELGGEDGVLGKKVSETANCSIGHENACVQQFENGVIIYSPEHGAWENYGEIRNKFIELHSVDGTLGFPTGPMNCLIGHEGACVQQFEKGVIIYSPEHGAWENYGEIRNKFIELHSVDGTLGFPTGPMNCSIGHENACPEHGAWENYGEIRNKFIELRSVDGILGFPTGPMNCLIGHEGACVQQFEKGVIIYSPEHGAWENYGGIRNKFLELRSVNGEFGFPTGSVKPSAYVNNVSYQTYEHGIIYWNKDTGLTWGIKN